MTSTFLILALMALSAAANPPTPVYRRATSIVNSVPIQVPSGKSLPMNTGNTMNTLTEMPLQPAQLTQPIAEERESIYSGQDVSVGGANPVGTSGSQPGGAVQTYKIHYYPDAGLLRNGQTASFPAAAAPYNPDQEVNTWNKYHMTDILVGVVSIGLVGFGGYLLVPELLQIKGRSLRELTEGVTTDSVARALFKGIEKYNAMNSVE